MQKTSHIDTDYFIKIDTLLNKLEQEACTRQSILSSKNQEFKDRTTTAKNRIQNLKTQIDHLKTRLAERKIECPAYTPTDHTLAIGFGVRELLAKGTHELEWNDYKKTEEYTQLNSEENQKSSDYLFSETRKGIQDLADLETIRKTAKETYNKMKPHEDEVRDLERYIQLLESLLSRKYLINYVIAILILIYAFYRVTA